MTARRRERPWRSRHDGRRRRPHRDHEALRAAANWRSYAAEWQVSGEQGGRLRLAGDPDPVQRLWRQLPPPWRGPVIGPGIEGWEAITENGDRRIDLTGLPDPFPAELAWMAHWQSADGTRCSVLAMNQLAGIVRQAVSEGHPFPSSMLAMDWDAAVGAAGLVLRHPLGG
jgi:hypothetical protein